MTYRKRAVKATKPMRVAEVLKGYLRSAGLAERVGQASVVDEWPALVGPRIAKAAAAESVSQDGTLFVRVPSSAWRQELSLLSPEILDLVNRGRSSGRIKRIRWLVGEETGAQGHGGTGAQGHGGTVARGHGGTDARAHGPPAPAPKYGRGTRAPRGER